MTAAARRSAGVRVALVVLIAMSACVLAWRSGGGADESGAPPRPDDAILDGGAPRAAEAAAVAAPLGAEGYEVALRLVENMSAVRIDAPAAALGQRSLGAHWRKLRPPWFAVNGAATRFVTSIALRTSTLETQWSLATGAGKAWTPDAKIWNMNEGSYEQRDAIVAAPPSTFAFRVAVPAGAKLTFAEGTINAMRDSTIFVVSAVDAAGQAREIYRHRLPLTAARRWTEASCSLEAFAGQTIELRLSTETAPATAEERRALFRQREEARRAEEDAGVDAAAPIPSADDADAGAPKEAQLAVPGVGIGLWGSPTILTRTVPRLPYNVLWIVVDALRPDVLASFHDDAEDQAKLAAPSPPLEALLPKVPGLTPAIDELAKRGVRFTHAYSAASWTRPGTLAMLAGARSTEIGLDTQSWVLQQADVARFYASDPPLLPLLARRHGASTHAFVNNYFMVGYAPVGVEMGFEHVADHRYRTRDTLEMTRDATTWIRRNKDTRFFLFVNYNSPHEPYEPPAPLLERIPPPPAGPADKVARLYMAEAAKDDEAIGVLLQSIADAGLRERTIVVVTADHGETMSSAHQGISALDRMPVRYHHAVSNYEETTHVPILIVAPGLLPDDRVVKERVRTVDIAPTVAELLGLEARTSFTGRSLAGLARGQREQDERVVLTEGRGTRAIMHGRHRLIVREGLARTTTIQGRTVTVNEELFDLVDDPGERLDLAKAQPDLVAEMHARLVAALAQVPVAGSSAATAAPDDARPPVIHVRFVGGGRARRVSGSVVIGDGRTKAPSFSIVAIEVGADALKIAGPRAEVALTTSSSAAVGFDIVVDPPGAPVTWDLYLDDKPWPDDAVFGGPYGLLAPGLRQGLKNDEARLAAQSALLPPIDPRRDVGLFVVRERRGGADDARVEGDESAEEMARLLREWGYAHGPGSTK
jgi:arylsulfatase A-like enzyme